MFGAIIGTIISGAAKIGIGTIANRLSEAYLAKENAKTDREKLKADVTINMLEARKEVMIAESAFFWPTMLRSIMRALWGLPPAIYFAKLWLWDKVLGWGTTDGISDNMMWVAMAAVSFYFLTEMIGPKK